MQRAPLRPKILLVRTSALGDVVHCLPVLTALRKARPEARIGWVIEEAFAPLLAGHPDLDEILPVRLRPWRERPLAARTLGEVARFIARLQGFAADVVLDLMGNHKAGIIAALSLADERIGLARRFRREPASAVWISRGVAASGRHAVERALSVLAPLGIEAGVPDFGPEKLLAAERGWHEDGFVLIHPGAGWGNKAYPAPRWGAVAAELHARGFPVRVAVARGEEALAAAIEAASGGVAEPLAAPSLPTLVRALRSAALVLAGDTGPLHLAHALGTPVLAVMGPTDPERHGPYGQEENAVFERFACSFCYQRLAAARPCLLALAPATIALRAAALLAPSGRERGPASN